MQNNSFANMALASAEKEEKPHRKKNNPTRQQWERIRNIAHTAKSYEKKNMCKTWEQYKNFLQDMGRKPEGHSLARYKDKQPFSKKNCYWGLTNYNALSRYFGNDQAKALRHNEENWEAHEVTTKNIRYRRAAKKLELTQPVYGLKGYYKYDIGTPCHKFTKEEIEKLNEEHLNEEVSKLMKLV